MDKSPTDFPLHRAGLGCALQDSSPPIEYSRMFLVMSKARSGSNPRAAAQRPSDRGNRGVWGWWWWWWCVCVCVFFEFTLRCVRAEVARRGRWILAFLRNFPISLRLGVRQRGGGFCCSRRKQMALFSAERRRRRASGAISAIFWRFPGCVEWVAYDNQMKLYGNAPGIRWVAFRYTLPNGI